MGRKAASRLDDGGIGRLAPVADPELAVLACQIFGLEDGLGASPHEFGSAGAEVGGQGVESFDEVVVELHEDFASSHAHMVVHMVDGRLGRDAAFGGQRAPLGSEGFPAALLVLVSQKFLDLGGQFVSGGDGLFDVEADVVLGLLVVRLFELCQ